MADVPRSRAVFEAKKVGAPGRTVGVRTSAGADATKLRETGAGLAAVVPGVAAGAAALAAAGAPAPAAAAAAGIWKPPATALRPAGQASLESLTEAEANEINAIAAAEAAGAPPPALVEDDAPLGENGQMSEKQRARELEKISTRINTMLSEFEDAAGDREDSEQAEADLARLKEGISTMAGALKKKALMRLAFLQSAHLNMAKSGGGGGDGGGGGGAGRGRRAPPPPRTTTTTSAAAAAAAARTRMPTCWRRRTRRR